MPGWLRVSTRLLCGALLAVAGMQAAVAGEAPMALGERIYLQGLLPDGTPLQGVRGQGAEAAGSAVACANCHKRSGLGSGEGTIRIPPITSRFIFNRSGVQPGRPTLDAQAASDASRAAYDERTLADAIRRGRGRGGRELSYLMPRYALDDASMAALITYLKALPTQPSPGIGDTMIEFATVFTPDSDPQARAGVLAVLNQFIADKNAFLRGGAKPLQSQGQVDFRVTRGWRLHAWTLQGAPDTWEAQLQEHLRQEPVFAVLSGLGGAEWAPVHRFCQRERLPCLFPNVAVPVEAEADFYSVYFSRGLWLESDVVAGQLAAVTPGKPGHRLLQLSGEGGGAAQAAQRLAAHLPPGWQALSRSVPAGDVAALAQATADAAGFDALMLWLGADDLAGLAGLGAAPPAHVATFVSGTLGGLEQAPLPAGWRSAARLVYPVDLPSARAVRMNYPLRWFQIEHIPVVAERAQADTYLACGIVSEALKEMQDSFMRDFLLERIESMISHRQLSGYYPRLGLAAGQRFASKGAYLVHFTAPQGPAIAADSEWLVP
jgi:hypothetical protein